MKEVCSELADVDIEAILRNVDLARLAEDEEAIDQYRKVEANAAKIKTCKEAS